MSTFFLQSLEFLENPPPPQRTLDEARITAELTNMFARNAEFDEITRYVDATVGAAIAQPLFIRVLTNALLDYCIVRKYFKMIHIIFTGYSTKLVFSSVPFLYTSQMLLLKWTTVK